MKLNKENQPCHTFESSQSPEEKHSVCIRCGYTRFSHENQKVVKKMIVDPLTQKRSYVIEIKVNGVREQFAWNKVYHVYNSKKNYRQFTQDQIENLIWL